MAFGNISTFYLPIDANAGSSQWGTDVRKVLSAPDATSDVLSLTTHGNGGGSTTRTIDPYTNSSADSDQSLLGWAITPSDMNSVSGARRFFPAGNHTATIMLGHNGVGSSSATLHFYIYRVGPAAGRTRTLLGSGNTVFTLPAVAGDVSVSVPVTLPEVILEVDETIQYSFELLAVATVVTGHGGKFYTGTRTGVESRIDTPELGVLASTVGSAAGSGAATAAAAIVLGAVGSSAGSSTATGVGASRADIIGTATGTSTAVGVGASRADTVGTASGSSTATAEASIVLGTIGTVNVSDAPSDYSPNDGLKAIADVVRHHETDALVAGAAVKLVRDADEFHAATTTSGASGEYSFARDTNDPNTYHVYVHYLDGATNIQGVSERGLVPA